MRSSLSGLCAILALGIAAPAVAQDAADPPADLTVSANVGLFSDYRFRGVGLSGGDIAVQGGIDLVSGTGLYVGTWASSITGGAYGTIELDLYGGFRTELTPGVTVDVGLLYYAYPNSTPGLDLEYFEPYASIATTMGPVGVKVGVAYAWDQASLGSDDNLYVYSDFTAGIPDTPLSLRAHVGYTDGPLAPAVLAGGADRNGFDYLVGADLALGSNLTAGIAYVGVDGPVVDGLTDDTVVVSIKAAF